MSRLHWSQCSGDRLIATALLAGAARRRRGTATAAYAAGCVTVPIATSPEKLELLTDLAKRFEDSSEANVGGTCVRVKVQKQSSGAAASLLAADWPKPKVNGPRPVIWSPSASTWGAVLDQRRADAGKAAYVTTPGKSFMLTPLVIAMPRPMAEALGYPQTPLGISDVLALGAGPVRMGGEGASGVGAVPLRQDQPQLLDERARRDGRAVLRRDGQDE